MDESFKIQKYKNRIKSSCDKLLKIEQKSEMLVGYFNKIEEISIKHFVCKTIIEKLQYISNDIMKSNNLLKLEISLRYILETLIVTKYFIKDEKYIYKMYYNYES